MTTHIARWVPAMDHFAVRLVLVRHEMGWNAKEAAMACGISPQSWREWELSGRRPRDYEGVCKQIAERTGCDLMWLMAGDPSPGALPASFGSASLSSQRRFDQAGSPRLFSDLDDDHHQPFDQPVRLLPVERRSYGRGHGRMDVILSRVA